MELAEDEKVEERVENLGKYLLRHWKEIRDRRTENLPGSCTEGLMSHLLSERFSRNPMGWIREAKHGKVLSSEWRNAGS